MLSISSLLLCLTSCMDSTTLRQLSVIVPALLSMTGRVTMLGISRWASKGGSYRTIQRFFIPASPGLTFIGFLFGYIFLIPMLCGLALVMKPS